MPNPLQLEGIVTNPHPHTDETFASLRTKLQRAREDNEEMREALLRTAAERDEARQAIGRLRRALEPLYQSLQMVWGDISTGTSSDSQANGGMDPRKAERWAMWKPRLSKKGGEAIDILLAGGPMTQQALRVALAIATRTVQNVVSELRVAGLIERRGDGKIALKEE